MKAIVYQRYGGPDASYVYDVGTWTIEASVAIDNRVFESVVLIDAGIALVTTAFAAPGDDYFRSALIAAPEENAFIGGGVFGDSRIVSYPDLVPQSRPLLAEVAALSPSGRLLATAITFSSDINLSFWDVQESERLYFGRRGIAPLDREVSALRFSPDSQMLSVIGRGMEVLRIGNDLEVSGPATIARSYSTSPNYDHAWSADGAFLVTATNGELLIWRPEQRPTSPPDVAAAAAASLTRSFTESECDEFLIDPCPSLVEVRSRHESG